MNSYNSSEQQRVALKEVEKVIGQKRSRRQDIKCLQITNIMIKTIGPQLKHKLQQLYNLEVLIMIECQLTTLENLPALKHLQHLDLTKNNITDTDIPRLSIYPKLKILHMGFNLIANLQTLTVFKSLGLQQLQLYENPIQYIEDFSKLAFQKIPSLRVLNGVDVNGQPILDCEEDEDLILEASDSGSDDMEDLSDKIRKAHEDMDDEFKQNSDFSDEQEEDKTIKKTTKKGAKKSGKKE